MTSTATDQGLTSLRGAEWLLKATAPDRILTPDRLTDEQRLIARTTTAFAAAEVLPVLERLEQKDWQLAKTLVRRAGELGLLGTDVSDEFGGVGLDKVASIVVGESMGRAASFATTFGAQTGLAITPIVCFGTAAQKALL